MNKTEKLKTDLENWLKNFKTEKNVKGVVLGLSGGKDSTVVSMLAKKIWGSDVIAVMMPNGIQKDISDSVEIAKELELNTMTVNIEGAFNAIVSETEKNGITISEKSRTNIPPRIRMTVLYGIAQSLGYLVIGTGNASEKFIGWTTKYGDSAYDFNPIGGITKTEVVEIGLLLAEEFGLDKKFITKAPGDGLTGKNDEDNFGFTYEELDKVIKGEQIDSITQEKIMKMNRAAKHKREMPPTFMP